MPHKNRMIFWIVFISVMFCGYVFMIFFMEGITSKYFHVEKKKVHLENVTEAVQKIDKKADVTIDKASATYLKKSDAVENGEKKTIMLETGIPLTGPRALLVSLFNDSRVVYSIVVTLTMACVGVLIGFITDILLKMLGLDVSKISHHE